MTHIAVKVQKDIFDVLASHLIAVVSSHDSMK